jgi:hypothetical protein
MRRVLLLLLALPRPAAGQAAEDYYAFWPGTWYTVENGVRDSVPTFVVRPTVSPRAFLEEWRLVIDGRPAHSIALRAWDAPTRRWQFAWVDASGLVQFWDGVEVDGDWAIQREFTGPDGPFLSRQRWIPQGPDRVVRVLERSVDGGRTWATRYRTELVRLPESGTGSAREALLRLHHEHRIAHRTGDAALWVRSFADTVLQVNGGRTDRETAAGFLPRAEAYFASARFLEWEDVRPPVLIHEAGTRTAMRVVEKRVRLVDGPAAEASVVYAWMEHWRLGSDGWRLTAVVSTERLPEDALPATARQRVSALAVLERARGWVATVGAEPDAAVRVSTTGFDARCTGPRGAYRMDVRSARDGRVSMVQYDGAGRVLFGAGVALDGAWSAATAAVGDTLPASLASAIDAHEFTLLALAPEARYRAPAAIGRQRFAGRAAETVRFEDRVGEPALFFYDAETGEPLGIRVADHVRNRTTPVDIVFAEWSTEGALRLPSRVRTTQADETFDCTLVQSTTGWLSDVEFRRPPR